MSRKPTIIFVPGAWHSAHCYDKVVEKLQTIGYETDQVHLASVSDITAVLDRSADIARIRSSIVRCIEAEQDVMVVCHSYGGIPTTEALTENLTASVRRQHGQKGGVTHLVYCSAFLPPKGWDAMKVVPKGEFFTFQDNIVSIVDRDAAKSVFYTDMADEDVDRVYGLLSGHSLMSWTDPVAQAGWKHVPCTYVFCTLDNAIPLKDQQQMVEEARNAGSDIQTKTLECAHSPFYAKADELALLIQDVAESQSTI